MKMIAVGGNNIKEMYPKAPVGGSSLAAMEKKTEKAEETKVELDSVLVSISDKGWAAFHDSLTEKGISGKEYFEEFVRLSDELESRNDNELDYASLFLRNEHGIELGINHVENHVANNFQAYVKTYDQIVKGYAEGTREIYVADENSETGFRKMTMEEELKGLEKMYQERMESCKVMAEMRIKNLEHEARYREKMKRMNWVSSIRSEREFQKDLEKKKYGPKEVERDMSTAREQFLALYWNTSNSMDIETILKSIELFKQEPENELSSDHFK